VRAPADVLRRRGRAPRRHRRLFEPAFEPETTDWVRHELTPVLDRVGGRPLLIGKSLGTYGAERGLPAVWFTPLLTVLAVAAWPPRPRRSCSSAAPPASFWDEAVARRLTDHVRQVPDADHGMYVPGPLTASIAVLAEVVVAVETFLDRIGWPD
jgi:hypothetical protein